MPQSNKEILKIENLSKKFSTIQGEITILDQVSFNVMAGEKVAIVGPSGSGKSTLLSIMGLLDGPTSGVVTIDGQVTSNLNESEQALFRNEKIGFIFQSFELISPFSVTENVTAPLEMGGVEVNQGEVTKLINDIGLIERRDAMPGTLSGGEKQRVAIARALVRRPAILLADEPTGSLDRVTGEKVLTMLMDAVEVHQTTLIIITHDESVAARMDRVFELRDKSLHERH